MMDIVCPTGQQLLEALENGVSAYPKLEGRFPQIAGMEFGFDPKKTKGHRVDPKLVQIQEKYLNLEKVRACFFQWLSVITWVPSTLPYLYSVSQNFP